MNAGGFECNRMTFSGGVNVCLTVYEHRFAGNVLGQVKLLIPIHINFFAAGIGEVEPAAIILAGGSNGSFHGHLFLLAALLYEFRNGNHLSGVECISIKFWRGSAAAGEQCGCDDEGSKKCFHDQ